MSDRSNQTAAQPASFPPAPNSPNAIFIPYEQDFWLLYELCRYHALICSQRVVAAARTDNTAVGWLLVSAVGAGSAGAIKLLTGLRTEPVWEAASLLSVALAILALYRKAPEIKYTVFSSIGTFQDLASQLRQDTITFRGTGSDQAIRTAYDGIYTAFSDELQKLGPDHTAYEARHKRKIGRALKQILKAEGRVRR